MLDVLKPALANIHAMATSAIAALPQVLLGLLVFGIFLRVARWGREWTHRAVGQAGKREEAALVIGQLSYGALIVGGMATAAAVMGVGLGRVLAGIGVSGVVVGFAFKDILENYLAGILLMLARPFVTGDAIKTGDYEGRVLAISTRSTTIDTGDGQLVVIPNAKIYSQPLINLSSLGIRRSILPLHIELTKDLDETRHTLEAIVGQNPLVLQDPGPELLATALDATGVNVELRFWSRAHDAATAKGQLVEEIRRQLFAPIPSPP